MTRRSLDARNVLCPLPVIRTQDTIATMQAGEELRVICSDPGAVFDIPSWCRVNGHEVLEIEESEDRICIVIRVGMQ